MFINFNRKASLGQESAVDVMGIGLRSPHTAFSYEHINWFLQTGSLRNATLYSPLIFHLITRSSIKSIPLERDHRKCTKLRIGLLTLPGKKDVTFFYLTTHSEEKLPEVS